MSDWIDGLSDYLDGQLSRNERAELEAALERDGELRRVLEQLQAVRSAAASLPSSAPASDLWPAIEARIGTAEIVDFETPVRARRRISLTVPQLAAAAVALFLIGSTSVWLTVGAGSGGAGSPAPQSTAAPEAGFVSLPAAEGAALSYEMAVRDLEEQLEAGREQLDPSTVAAVERSLATIDRAIARAQKALEVDPASAYLNRHLTDAQTRKLGVLQQAARLARS
jgi:anti-sigma factor RsiW